MSEILSKMAIMVILQALEKLDVRESGMIRELQIESLKMNLALLDENERMRKEIEAPSGCVDSEAGIRADAFEEAAKAVEDMSCKFNKDACREITAELRARPDLPHTPAV